MWSISSPRGIWISAATFFFFFFAPSALGGTTEGRRCTYIFNFAHMHHNAGLIVHANNNNVPTKLSSPSLGTYTVHGRAIRQWLLSCGYLRHTVPAARASQCCDKWKKLHACIGFPGGRRRRKAEHEPRLRTGKRDLPLTWRRTLFFVRIALCRGGVGWCGVVSMDRWMWMCGWGGCVLRASTRLLRYHRGSEENVQRYLGGFGQPPPPANYS